MPISIKTVVFSFNVLSKRISLTGAVFQFYQCRRHGLSISGECGSWMVVANIGRLRRGPLKEAHGRAQNESQRTALTPTIFYIVIFPLRPNAFHFGLCGTSMFKLHMFKNNLPGFSDFSSDTLTRAHGWNIMRPTGYGLWPQVWTTLLRHATAFCLPCLSIRKAVALTTQCPDFHRAPRIASILHRDLFLAVLAMRRPAPSDPRTCGFNVWQPRTGTDTASLVWTYLRASEEGPNTQQIVLWKGTKFCVQPNRSHSFIFSQQPAYSSKSSS